MRDPHIPAHRASTFVSNVVQLLLLLMNRWHYSQRVGLVKTTWIFFSMHTALPWHISSGYTSSLENKTFLWFFFCRVINKSSWIVSFHFPFLQAHRHTFLKDPYHLSLCVSRWGATEGVKLFVDFGKTASLFRSNWKEIEGCCGEKL